MAERIKDGIRYNEDASGNLSAIAGSGGYTVAVTLTRTADGNAYGAGDVVGAAPGSTAALTFAAIGPSGGTIKIISSTLEIDSAAVISGETSYDLHLYSVTPPSALGDNVAFDVPAGDRPSYLGKISLGTPADLGASLYIDTNNINKQIKLAGTSLFAYLVTVGAHTPASGRVYVITLNAVMV